MNEKLKISKYFLFISIFSFLAILFYIAQTGYSKLMGQVTSDKDIKSYEYEIIDTNINTDILEDIKQKQEYTSPVIPVQEFTPDTSGDISDNEDQ